MSDILLLTSASEPPVDILPALALLLHSVRTAPAEAVSAPGPSADVLLIDARRDLVRARELCRLLRSLALEIPVLAVMTEGGLAAVTAEWGADDVVLHTAGPAEVEARLRLAVGRTASQPAGAPDQIFSGDLSIDEATYSVRLRSRALDLTFKEFELLKFLAQRPGRVFTRAHLLQEVWGYDYFGGTRTVDVHVRRLRAKLGPEHEALIGTVRNVGYRFVPLKGGEDGRAARPQPGGGGAHGDGSAHGDTGVHGDTSVHEDGGAHRDGGPPGIGNGAAGGEPANAAGAKAPAEPTADAEPPETATDGGKAAGEATAGEATAGEATAGEATAGEATAGEDDGGRPDGDGRADTGEGRRAARRRDSPARAKG